MIPIKQIDSGFLAHRGDCLEACIASILEKSIDEVPRLDRWQDVSKFLEAWGWSKDQRHGFLGETLGTRSGPTGFSIAAVLLPCGIVHSVVCENGVLVHDPAMRPAADDACTVLLWTSLRKNL